MPSGVQIMLMDNSIGSIPEQELLSRLHPEERSRYQTFTHPARRRSWLAGRMLMLAALARVSSEVDAAALRTTESGGVRYKDGSLRLSLSHSHELLCVALTTAPVGLDIEWPKPRTSVDKPARVFSPSESDWLETLSESARLDGFYALWTLKEAVCKALGLDLGECLRSARFDITSSRFTPEPPLPAGPWACMQVRLGCGFRLALAVQDATIPLKVECWRLADSGEWQREVLVQPAFIYAR